MQVPKIIPVSYPDTVEDAADGATFFVDLGTPWEGQAFIATCDFNSAKDARLCVRLSDGRAVYFHLTARCRVVALAADTAGEDW